MPLHIGYAQTTITPDLSRPVFLAGFDRNRLAESVHDDLYARALALSNDSSSTGTRRLVLVALDLIGLSQFVCQELAFNLPGVDLVVACTHTHHGPDTIGLWGPDQTRRGVDPVYIDQLKAAIVAAARRALDDLKPAAFRAASIRVPGVVKNARDPSVLDDELTLIQFRQAIDSSKEEPPESRQPPPSLLRAVSQGGLPPSIPPAPRPSIPENPRYDGPLVTLAIFACHPETLWKDNTHITSDYPGALRRAVEQAAGGPCLFFAGALGGMMTPDVKEHTFAEAARIGLTLARSGLEALAGSVPQTTGSFTYSRREFGIRLKSQLFEDALRIGLLRGVVLRKGHVQTETSILRLGPVWLAFVPGELLPALGLAIKTRLRQAGAQIPAIIGLANDEIGYILPDEDYRYPDNPFEPGDHYEETMSIGPTAGSTLFANLAGLIDEAAIQAGGLDGR